MLYPREHKRAFIHIHINKIKYNAIYSVYKFRLDEIKSSIKDYIRANTTFTDYDYEGSNLSVLINILAYNTYLSAYNSNMVANEVFLDTATLRENVVALAKILVMYLSQEGQQGR